MCHVDVTGVHLISIPAPPRGATDGSAPSRRILKFQFTPLREGRRKSSTLNRRKSLFQFPPLREGRHKQLVTKGDADVISIHAPPRGATQQVAHMQHNAQFQFTPLREGRRGSPRQLASSCDFNSRPSARGDSTLNAAPIACLISIPAPPRGATCRHAADCHVEHFNSRPSARGDTYWTARFSAGIYFNSRPSARGDNAADFFRVACTRLQLPCILADRLTGCTQFL